MLGHFIHRALWWSHGKMIEIMTMVFPRVALKSLNEDIYHQFNGCVANGMNAHLQSSIMYLVDLSSQLSYWHIQVAPIIRLIAVWLASIGGGAGKPSVNKDFDRPDFQPIVAIANLVA